ncbi:MAG: HD domain-containing protein [Lachnospiraceae bacterium]|nr:HD domain-containing protein [Lachnospiraceae bacterium]
MKPSSRKLIGPGARVFLVAVACILINYAGKTLASNVELPLWLDSIGTAFCAYIYGPICGAIVGISVNIMYGFQDSMAFVYSIVNLATGIIIGLAAKKGAINTFFETSKVAALVTLVSTAISAPLNIIFYEGMMGNKWGDAVVEFLRHRGFNTVAASSIGEFFIDFADKIVTLGVLFLFVKAVRRIRKKSKNKKKKNIASVVTMILLATLLVNGLPQMQVMAEDKDDEEDYDSYIQTIYNNTNGFSCGEANDIVATNDGVLWIATYAGLYRYSGSEFRYMSDYSSIKNANDLFVDEEGRLWVGTNDMGISICTREEVSNILDTRSGLPSNSVRSIIRNSNGDYLVGTSGSMAVVSLSGGIRTKEVIDEIQYAQSLAADASGHTAAVTAQGQLYLLDGTEVKASLTAEEGAFTSCRYNSDSLLYVTSDAGDIYLYNTSSNQFVEQMKISIPGLTHLNNTYEMENGVVFVCADNGVCYLDKKYNAHEITTGAFNSSIDNMTVDYQGNIWFSSSRQGLLKLCPSAFSELFTIAGVSEKVVNAVTVWQDKIYCGTDKGLDIIDQSTGSAVTSELAEELDGIRIRNLYVDSKNRLWICSTAGYVIRVEADGSTLHLGAEEGVIGSKFRQALELQDGTIAIASDKGVSVIDDTEVVYTLDSNAGITNPIVLCMCQREDGTIFLGTDGGGIVVVKNGKVIENYTSEELGSDIILRIAKDRDAEGVFVVTSNGLCYISAEDEILQLSTFPYSNNFDIYDNGEGLLFVTGSAGIYVVKKEELLNGERVHYEQLNYINGLRQTITANSWNCVENDATWYICNNAGVTRLDLTQYQKSAKSFRLIISSMRINDVTHMVNRSEDIVLAGEDVVLELVPEIINYTAEDPTVRYYMEGYDKAPIDVRQSELRSVEYRGLPSGTYKFHLAVINKYGNVAEEQIYTIVRQQDFYEQQIFIIYFFVELAVIIAWIAWVITRTFMQKALESKNREVEHALEQVRLGNETILTIAKTVDAKDENTSQHSFRVSEYSVRIGKKLGYDEETCEDLRKSALLHDIGKIGIPDRVLNKPAKLDDEEYAIMKSHVTRGGEILKDFTFIPHVQEGALYHHERYDGKGYAHGLKGEEIPEFARIIGVADAFDAMTANRVYRKKLDLDFVIGEIKRCRGTQFDPRMADILLDLIASGEIDVTELYQSSQKEATNE